MQENRKERKKRKKERKEDERKEGRGERERNMRLGSEGRTRILGGRVQRWVRLELLEF